MTKSSLWIIRVAFTTLILLASKPSFSQSRGTVKVRKEAIVLPQEKAIPNAELPKDFVNVNTRPPNITRIDADFLTSRRDYYDWIDGFRVSQKFKVGSIYIVGELDEKGELQKLKLSKKTDNITMAEVDKLKKKLWQTPKFKPAREHNIDTNDKRNVSGTIFLPFHLLKGVVISDYRRIPDS